MNTPMPIATMIALATLVLALIIIFAKIIRSNSRLTAAVEQLRIDYTANLISVEKQFQQIHGSSQTVDKKLDDLKEIMHQVQIEMKGVTTEIRLSNNTKT